MEHVVAIKLRSRAWPSVRFAWALLLLPLIANAGDSPKLETPTAHERIEYLRRARVWEPTDVASKDLYNGPEGKLNFAVDQEITCDFVPKPLGGWTEKFLCRLEDGRIFKVKYVANHRYKEVYGEVLGTRLFWALGFYADRMLPVRVTCRGCPRQPWKYVDARKSKKRLLDEQGLIRSLPPEAECGTYTFDPAAMEEQLDVELIEERKDQGWSWKSLARVDASLLGATKAEIDAFKLLNAFVQNSDSKFKQNSLACPRNELALDAAGHMTCRRPICYVSDLGSVFGKGGFTTGNDSRVDYEGWKKPMWRRRGSCKARLVSIGGIFRTSTLKHPVVSEEGRALLAQQLEQLSDAQIADLFRAARIERLHQTTTDGCSGRREVTVEDWVKLFKAKRDEITKHPGCKTRRSVKVAGGAP